MPSLQKTAIEYHQSGRVDEAEYLYNQVLKKQPQDKQVSYLLGAIYYSKQRYYWARDHLLNAVSGANPTSAALECLGHTYKALKQYPEAAEAYNRSIDIDKNNTEARKGLAGIFNKIGKPKDALDIANTFINANPKDPSALIIAGCAHDEMGNKEEAIKLYNRAYEASNHAPEPLFHLGKLYLKQFKYDWAKEALEKCLLANPNHTEAILCLGDFYQAHGMTDEATQCFKQAHALDPNNLDALLKLGSLFESISLRSEALALYNNAYALAPGEQTVLQKLGHLLLLMGHTGRAEELFVEALKINPDCIAIHHDLSQLRNPGTQYYKLMDQLHDWLKPRTYFEIGIRTGQSLSYAKSPTISIGVDCEPFVVYTYNAPTRVYPITSDAFFEKYNLKECLDGMEVDFAFIDGLHLFYQVLRDFINTEKHAHTHSVIIFHDTIPLDDITADPDPKTFFWTGDPWKIIPCLKKYRPDLEIAVSPSHPTGIGIVTRLDPNSTILEEKFDEIVAEYQNQLFSEIQNPFEELNYIPATLESIQQFINTSRQKS